MTEDSITRREGPVIEVAVDDILDSVHERGWAHGAWQTDDGAGCLHQHIRWCQPVPGDAYLIEQVAIRQGWGPQWNDVDGRTVDDLKGVLVDHRDITDQDLADTFGPQWEHTVALVRRSAVLTEDEAERLAAARDAAWDATWDAARDAAWALVVRDLIGEHWFTQAHYDTLTGPWRTVVGPVHPDDEVVA
jgi:hypothetical protein